MIFRKRSASILKEGFDGVNARCEIPIAAAAFSAGGNAILVFINIAIPSSLGGIVGTGTITGEPMAEHSLQQTPFPFLLHLGN